MDKQNKDNLPGENKSKEKKKITDFNIFLIQYFKLIVVGVAILFLAACYFFLLRPKYDDIRITIAESYENKQAEYQKLSDYLDNLNAYLGKYKSISQSDKDRLDIMLPESNSYKELYILVDSIVARHNMFLIKVDIIPIKKVETTKKTITKIEEDEDDVSAKLGEIRVELDLMGTSYENIKAILATLENSLRILDVRKVSYDPDLSSGSLEFIAYYLESEKKAEDIKKP